MRKYKEESVKEEEMGSRGRRRVFRMRRWVVEEEIGGGDGGDG